METSRLMTAKVVLFSVVLSLIAGSAWGTCGVRISDLHYSPTPPNPIRVWGKVTSESPVKISDGSGEMTVTGRTATAGEFLVLDGYWNGQFLSVFGSEMIYIPAGSFLMGNSGVGNDLYYDQQYSLYNEKPQHTVDLSGYYIGKYDVTRAEYQAFMNAGGYTNSAYWSTAGWSWRMSNNRTQPAYWDAVQNWSYPYDPGQTFTQTDNHPVLGVCYYEAEAFCNWAGGHLPTEAQWEKAARWTGTHPNLYPWGDTWDEEKCNNYYDLNTAGGGYGKFQTSPVGSYPSGASPNGCMDMAGNVWQWVQDWYVSYPGSSNPFDYTNIYRVVRGGGWLNYGYYDYFYRCAYRGRLDPSSYYGDVGFRLVR